LQQIYSPLSTFSLFFTISFILTTKQNIYWQRTHTQHTHSDITNSKRAVVIM